MLTVQAATQTHLSRRDTTLTLVADHSVCFATSSWFGSQSAFICLGLPAVILQWQPQHVTMMRSIAVPWEEKHMYNVR